MIEYVIQFPGDFYLSGSVAVADIRKASFYRTEEAARAALAKVAKHFKPDQITNIEIVKIGG